MHQRRGISSISPIGRSSISLALNSGGMAACMAALVENLGCLVSRQQQQRLRRRMAHRIISWPLYLVAQRIMAYQLAWRSAAMAQATPRLSKASWLRSHRRGVCSWRSNRNQQVMA